MKTGLKAYFFWRLMLAMILAMILFSLPWATVEVEAQCKPEQNHVLSAKDSSSGDFFGSPVSASGTTAIVGAIGDDDNGEDSGSAYLFDTITGSQFAKLLPQDGAAEDRFGISVHICGTTAIVGAEKDDDNGNSSGSAYLFDAENGQQIAKLLPNDGQANDEFGQSVGISGAIAIVGAPFDDVNADRSGSAYLFDTETGQQIAKLLPDDGAADDFFGTGVAIMGTTAIVGAHWDDDNGDNSGSAYIFDTTTGQQIAKLVPEDGAAGDSFGRRVAISGTIAIISARGDDDYGENSGSVYLYNTSTGQQIAKLLPDDGAPSDFFGFSVTIRGTTAIVGAYRDDDNGEDSGSAYVFDITTGQQIAKLLPSDGGDHDQFGRSVGLSGTTVIVGATNTSGSILSSAYLFDISNCVDVLLGDVNGDGVVNLLDVQPFVDLLISGGFQAEADINQDAVVDLLDVQPFVDLVNG